MDHRAVEDVAGRIAHGRRLQPRVEPAHELVVDALLDDRRPERRAALAGGAEAGEQRPLDREVEVGVIHHDHRVLAAELEARRLQVAAAERADLRADRAGAGEADLVDQPVLERPLEPGERLRSVGVDEVEHVARDASGMEQLGERGAGRGGILGRLPDDRVAAQDRRHEVPRRDGDREVAGGDDGRHADRHAEGEQLLVGHLGRDRLPVQPPALADEEIARVDDLLHLAQRLGVGLADLARHQPRQRLLVGLHEASHLGDHAAAGRRGHRGPGALRRARGARRVLEALRVRQQDVGDDLGQQCGVGRLEAAAGRVGALLATDDRRGRAGGRGGVGHAVNPSRARLRRRRLRGGEPGLQGVDRGYVHGVDARAARRGRARRGRPSSTSESSARAASRRGRGRARRSPRRPRPARP